MDPVEKKVREDHPDWTDEQVAAEVARLKKADDPPAPKPPNPGADEAMARLRREKEAADKRAKDAEDALAAKVRAEAEAQGQWETLAKQYESERDEARQDLADFKARIEVEGIARRLKFRNEDEALAIVKVRNPELDVSDKVATEAALVKLAEESDHLINTGAPPPSGHPVGDPPKGQLTKEDVEKMSPAELDERWSEVQTFLATQQ